MKHATLVSIIATGMASVASAGLLAGIASPQLKTEDLNTQTADNRAVSLPEEDDQAASAFLGEEFSWSVLDNGVNGTVFAVQQFDPDSFSDPPAAREIYVGGSFNQASGVSVNNIARFDGDSWNDVAGGVGGMFPIINDMIVWTNALYVTGNFSTAGGNNASGIARWDGESWSALGSGLNGAGWALEVYGGSLYVGGAFTQAGGQDANSIARWDGETWSSVGGGVTSDGLVRVYALRSLAGSLFVGGWFQQAGGTNASNIAQWDGKAWSALGGGVAGGPVRAFGVWNGGKGQELFVGGQFTTVGGNESSPLTRWHPFFNMWLSDSDVYGVGNNPPAVLAITTRSNNTVIVGGDFALTEGGSAVNLASFQQFSLVPYGGGADDVVTEVRNIPFFPILDLAAGLQECDRVFVGGAFNTLGQTPVSKIGYWNGCIGDCCVAHGGVGCDVPDCEEMVCDQESFCCESAWDGTCASIAQDLCPHCESTPAGPSNNESNNPLFIDEGDSYAFDNSHATTDGDPEPEHCDFVGDAQIHADLWYAYIVPHDGMLHVTLCNSSFNTKLGLYVIEPGSGQSITACDAYSCDGQHAHIAARVNDGEAYNLRVGGDLGESGFGQFSIELCDLGDVNCDGVVNVDDLLLLLNAHWGECHSAYCPADFTGTGVTDVDDLMILLNNWG